MTLATLRDRRGTAAEFSGTNPILGLGECGFETDTLRRKTGNGVSRWNVLVYDDQDLRDDLTAEINTRATADTNLAARTTALETEVDLITVAAAFGIPTFDNTASGIAGVANGALFSVVGSGDFIVYRRVDAAAVEVVRLPTVQRLTDLADCHVTLRNATPSLNKVIIDRTANTISFPRLEIAFPNNAIPTNPVNITPAGGSSAYTALAFSTNLTDRIFYFADMNAGTIIAETASKPTAASGVRVPLGSSHNGAFNGRYGWQVQDRVSAEMASHARNVQTESIMRSAERVPAQTVQTGRVPFVISSAKWFPLQPVFSDARVRTTGSAKLDLSYMIDGTSCVVVSSGAMQAFAGPGLTFLGTTSNSLTMTSGSLVTFHKVGTVIAAEIGVGTPTYATIADPIMEASVLHAGQSQHVRFVLEGGIGGFAEGLSDSAWIDATVDESRYHINGATGGTSLLKYSLDFNADEETNLDAWWYDDDTATDGPALLTCYAAIDAAVAAGQPAPETVLWAQGEGEVGALQSAGSLMTPARYNAGIDTVLGKIRAYLISKGATDPQFLITMLGSWDGAALRKGCGYVREAYLTAIADTAWMHFGAEMYDLPRLYRQIHMTETGNYSHGRRLALAYANVMHGGTNDLGPTVGTVTLGADTRACTIAFSDGAVMPYGNVTRTRSVGSDPNFEGGAPFLMAVIASTGAARTITSAAIDSNDDMTLSADVALTGARLFYPAGYAPEIASHQFVRNAKLDRRTNIPGLPLRSFVSAALTL